MKSYSLRNSTLSANLVLEEITGELSSLGQAELGSAVSNPFWARKRGLGGGEFELSFQG